MTKKMGERKHYKSINRYLFFFQQFIAHFIDKIQSLQKFMVQLQFLAQDTLAQILARIKEFSLGREKHHCSLFTLLLL